MSSLSLLITPRDGLFLKDGRGWYTSDIGRSHSRAWPIPSTIRGALRAAYGHAWMAHTGERLTRRAWERTSDDVQLQTLLTLRMPVGQAPAPGHRVWPVPADAIYQRATLPASLDHRPATPPVHIVRLDPEPPGDRRVSCLSRDRSDDPETHPDPSSRGAPAVEWSALWRPCIPPGKPDRRPDFWSEESMMRWLFGQPDGDSPTTTPATGFHLPRRVDVHVTIDPTTEAAVPTMLFSTELTEALARGAHREPDPGSSREHAAGFARWAMAATIGLPAALQDPTRFPGGPLTIGGGRRLSPCQPAPASLFDPPAELGGDSPGLRLVLVTPAEFAHGWLPDGFALTRDHRYIGTLAGMELILRAALVDRPLDLSTWDMVKRAPRETRRLVRPGAVYFFHKANNEPFTADDRRRLWLSSIGRGTNDGLGCVLPGRWYRKGS